MSKESSFQTNTTWRKLFKICWLIGTTVSFVKSIESGLVKLRFVNRFTVTLRIWENFKRECLWRRFFNHNTYSENR